MLTVSWRGLHFELYTDPNYPNRELLGEVTFGIQLSMPNDILFVPQIVKARIEAYVGANVLINSQLATPDLKLISANDSPDHNEHLLISTRALGLISTRAFYEASYKLKQNGDIRVLSGVNGKSEFKTNYKLYVNEELSSLGFGGRAQTLNSSTANSKNIAFPLWNPITSTWDCP